jgi:hypothetical protein
VFERLDGSIGRVERRATMIEEHALRLDAPLVAQVSRWDRLKDPLGVLTAFAEYVSELLAGLHAAERMGAAAQVLVRHRFLGPRHLGQYVDLLETVLGRSQALVTGRSTSTEHGAA